jgi:hypothetical protein
MEQETGKMRDIDRNAAAIARGLHPNGYGGIMSCTGAREFVARKSSLRFRFDRCRELNHVEVSLNGSGYHMEFSLMDENGRKSGVRKRKSVPLKQLRQVFENETGIPMADPAGNPGRAG